MTNYLTSLQNPLVKHLVKLRNDRNYRYDQQSFILEGMKPILEVLPYVKRFFRLESVQLKMFARFEEWIVTDPIMKKISGMTSSEGVVAEVTMPPFVSLKKFNHILALDEINDPGNLGTLLRTALALGWKGVYILPSCCDPYNEKAVRAARGAHFRLSLDNGDSKKLQQLAKENQLDILLADIHGTEPERVSKQSGKVLILGNEAHGASDAIRQMSRPVTIPMPGEMESLNVAVAGGILMYLLKRTNE